MSPNVDHRLEESTVAVAARLILMALIQSGDSANEQCSTLPALPKIADVGNYSLASSLQSFDW
jgi:hypothetical protein